MGPLGGLLGLHPELPLPALNLTDAQREQVRTILQGHREEGQALMQRGQAALEALRKVTEGTVDEGAAAQQGQALGAVIAEAAVLRSRVRGEIMAILTPEQQAEAAKIQADRELRMKQFRTKRDDRRPAKTPEIGRYGLQATGCSLQAAGRSAGAPRPGVRRAGGPSGPPTR